LPEAKAEAEHLRDQYGFAPVEPTAAAVRQFLSAGDFDVLHFACHGEAEQENVANAVLLMEGRLEGSNYIRDYLNVSTVEFHSRFQNSQHPGPIIFLNACQVGRAGYKLTGTGGFARAFLRRGASAFVGALWSVGDHPAMTFTKEFYRQLAEEHVAVAEATRISRAAAQKAGDATWLAYVVYAHPHAKLD
jgi:CHAT domain-containing protein